MEWRKSRAAGWMGKHPSTSALILSAVLIEGNHNHHHNHDNSTGSRPIIKSGRKKRVDLLYSTFIIGELLMAV
jgi:hypothetical protein